MRTALFIMRNILKRKKARVDFIVRSEYNIGKILLCLQIKEVLL